MGGSPPPLPGLVQLPAPAHAHVGVQRDSAVEMEEQVLATALGAFENAAVERAHGHALWPSLSGRARRDLAACQALIETPRQPQNRIALHLMRRACAAG